MFAHIRGFTLHISMSLWSSLLVPRSINNLGEVTEFEGLEKSIPAISSDYYIVITNYTSNNELYRI